MAAKPSASPGPPIGVPGFVESLDDVAPFAPGRWRSNRGTAIIGTGTSPNPEGAPHARPRLSLSLNGLSACQLTIQTWERMEGHDAMIWAAAIAFYALF